MKTSRHAAAILAAIPDDIRRVTTPTRDPRERPADYDRLLRLSSRYSHHRQFGRERAAEACLRMAERILEAMEE